MMRWYDLNGNETHPAAALARQICLAILLLLLMTALLPKSHAAELRAGSARDPALPTELVPLGHTLGIKLFSSGVMVVALSDIDSAAGDRSPAAQAGLKTGDVITCIDAVPVSSIDEVTALLDLSDGSPLTVLAQRDGREKQFTVTPAYDTAEEAYRLGAWIRDSMGGIGTATYYDPASGAFGALGHGVTDIDTMLLMPISSGAVMYATVTGVSQGAAGSPGQLHGVFDVTAEVGTLTATTDGGIFGDLCCPALTDGAASVPVADTDEVRTGPAVILSNIAGDEVESFDVELTRIFPTGGAADGRDYLLTVTDPRLLEATGGIVQGMSGSPILQDGKLVGAVTHVLISDPTRGYGISMEHMLQAAQSV